MTEAERAVLAYLEASGIPYERAEHERVSAIAECGAVEKLMGGCMPRNLFLAPRNRSAYWLLIAHAQSVFRTSSVSKQAGSARLSFADEAALWQKLHTHPGAVSPLGLIFDSARDVRLLVDRRLMSEEALLFHPLDNMASVKLSAVAFFERFLPSLGRDYTEVTLE